MQTACRYGTESWRAEGTRLIAKLHIATFELSSGGSIPSSSATILIRVFNTAN